MTIAEKNEQTLKFYFSVIRPCLPEQQAEVRKDLCDLNQCLLSIDWPSKGPTLTCVKDPKTIALLTDGRKAFDVT